MAEHEPLIVLLPWLRLRDNVKVGRFEFVTVSVGDNVTLEPAPPLSEKQLTNLQKLLKSHVSATTGLPVDSITIVRHPRGHKPWLVNSTHIEAVKEASRILAVSTIARNRYLCGTRISNSTQFEPIFYRANALEDDKTAIEIHNLGTRSIVGGYLADRVKSPCPIQCEILRSHKAETEIELVSGLEQCRDRHSDVFEQIQTAISFFLLAHSESPSITRDAIIILMAAAFEHLLQAGGREEVPKKLQRLLKASVTASNLNNARKIARNDGNAKTWPLHRVWMRDFFTKRNNIIHRNPDPWNYSWDDWELHLFAVWLFPQALRKKLIDLHHCQSDPGLEGTLRAVDKLLALRKWTTDEPGIQQPWDKLLSLEQSLWQIRCDVEESYNAGTTGKHSD